MFTKKMINVWPVLTEKCYMQLGKLKNSMTLITDSLLNWKTSRNNEELAQLHKSSPGLRTQIWHLETKKWLITKFKWVSLATTGVKKIRDRLEKNNLRTWLLMKFYFSSSPQELFNIMFNNLQKYHMFLYLLWGKEANFQGALEIA